jgi:hypothetical protein
MDAADNDNRGMLMAPPSSAERLAQSVFYSMVEGAI